jgi:hypothetical protein
MNGLIKKKNDYGLGKSTDNIMIRNIYHTLLVTQLEITDSALDRLDKTFKPKFLSILQFAIMEKSPFLDEILNLLKESSEFKLEELISDLELFIEFVIT